MSNGKSDLLKTADRERWAGTIFTFLATLLYGASNVAIRYLTDSDLVGGKIDYFWILFYKESIGLAILLPWLFCRWSQRRFQYCSKRLVLYIIIAAIFCQLIGSPLQVQGYAVIGLVIAIPVIQASILLGVALLGYFFFGDSLSRRRKTAIAILIIAVTILGIGKELTATETVQGDNTISSGLFLLVAVGAVFSGIAFAIYIVMLRYAIRQFWSDEHSVRLSFSFRHWKGHDHVKQPGERFYAPFPVTLSMALVFSVGVIIFGLLTYARYGVTGFYDVPHAAWCGILIAGICNVAGFFFQIQGLRMTSAVQASLIAVSQMLLLSFIGWWFFGEIITWIVMIGLGLTAYGVIISAKPEIPTKGG